MSVFSYNQRNQIVLVILIILGSVILYSLSSLFTAFLGAVVIYTLFKPFYNYLNKKLHPSLSASFIIILSCIIIVIPFFGLSYLIMDKIYSLQNDSFQLKAILTRLNEFVGLKLKQPQLIDNYINKVSLLAQELFPSFLGGAFDIFIAISIMYFILYFMLVQSEKFEKTLIKYAPLKEEHAHQFAKELKNTTYSNILGQGLIALTQGLLVSLAFFIVDINDALFWGIISVFLSFLPVIGAPIITLPASVFLYINGETNESIFILLFTIIILINIDNVIRFMINKKIADTHPLITILGVIIGIPLFGFVGLVFGPILLSWFIHLAEIYENDLISKKSEHQ